MSQDLIILPSCSYTIESLGITLVLLQGSDGGTFGLSRTGQVLWDGCFVVSRYVEQNSSLVTNRNVLELGCGCCGLPGQVAAVVGASHVIFSDISEELDCLQLTLQQNQSHFKVKPYLAVLDWNNALKEKRLYGTLQYTAFDTILCSDILYEHTYFAVLFVLLLLFAQSPKAVVIMSNTNRKHVHMFRRKATTFFNFKSIDTQHEKYGLFVNQVLWEIRLKTELDLNAAIDSYC